MDLYDDSTINLYFVIAKYKINSKNITKLFIRSPKTKDYLEVKHTDGEISQIEEHMSVVWFQYGIAVPTNIKNLIDLTLYKTKLLKIKSLNFNAIYDKKIVNNNKSGPTHTIKNILKKKEWRDME